MTWSPGPLLDHGNEFGLDCKGKGFTKGNGDNLLMPKKDFSSFCVEYGSLEGKCKRRESREKVFVMCMGDDGGPDWSWQWR